MGNIDMNNYNNAAVMRVVASKLSITIFDLELIIQSLILDDCFLFEYVNNASDLYELIIKKKSLSNCFF